MNRHPAYNVDEVRGRLLHESLLAEARSQIDVWCDGAPVTMPPRQEPPPVPHVPQIARTDTGSMRAVIVAS